MISIVPPNSLAKKYDRIIFCDLDGVLVDFKQGALNLGVDIGGQDKPHPNEDKLWQAVDAYGKDKFFANLPWMPDGQQLWRFINENFLDVKILTALGKSDKKDNLTRKGKGEWLQKNIPELRLRNVHMVPNKHAKKHYASPGDVLIDDTDICINEWLTKGGIGILHKNTQETIQRLAKLI